MDTKIDTEGSGCGSLLSVFGHSQAQIGMISYSHMVPRPTASPQGEAFWSVFLFNVLENKQYQSKKLWICFIFPHNISYRNTRLFVKIGGFFTCAPGGARF